MGLLEFLLLTLFNTIVCLCLPRIITLFTSINILKRVKSSRESLEENFALHTVRSHPELPQSESYVEFTPVTR
jgi:hypothetical protein